MNLKTWIRDCPVLWQKMKILRSPGYLKIWLIGSLVTGTILTLTGIIQYMEMRSNLTSHSNELARDNSVILTYLLSNLEWDVSYATGLTFQNPRNKDLHQVRDFLIARKEKQEMVQDYLIVDPAGHIKIWTGIPPAPNVSFHECFQYHKNHPNSKIFIGSPTFVSEPDRGPTFTISRALRDNQGKLEGIGVVLVNVRVIQEYYNFLFKSEHTKISLLKNDGTVLVMSPPDSGAPLALGAFHQYISETGNTRSSFTRIEKDPRGNPILFSFAPIPGMDLFAAGGVEMNPATTPWWNMAYGVFFAWFLSVSISWGLFSRWRNLSVQHEKNIHDQLETRKALARSEESYRLISGLTSDYVFKLNVLPDHKMEILYLSEGFQKISGLGMERGDLFAQFTGLTSPENSQILTQFFLQIAISKSEDSLEFPILTPDKKRIWFSVIASYQPGNGTEPPTITGALTNITRRKEAEIKKDQYLKLFQTSTDLMCIVDLRGRFIEINPTFSDTMGYSIQELQNRSIAHIIHPDDLPIPLPRLMAMLKRIKYFQFENRFVCRNRSEKILSWRSVYDPEGKCIYGTARDVTERKKLEEALVEREKDLSWAQDVAHLGHWSYSISEDTFTWSGEALKIFGLSQSDGPDDLDSLSEMIPAARWYGFDENFQEAIVHGRAFKQELEVIQKDGSIRHIYFLCQPRLEYERVIWLKGIVQDITERKEIEKSILESEQRFQGVATNITDAIWILDNQDKLVFANPRAEMIFSSSGKSLFENRENPLQNIHPEDASLLQKAMESEEYISLGYYDLEYRIISPGGEVRWLWGRSFPIRNEKGKIIYRGGVASDITDRKLAELSQRELNETLARRMDLEMVERMKTEAQYRTIFEISPEGLFLCDSRGRIIRCNSSAARMLGSNPDDLVGHSFPSMKDIILPDPEEIDAIQKPDWLRELFNTVQSGRTVSGDWTILPEKNRAMSVMVLGIRLGNGEESLWIWRDITEIQKLKQEKKLQYELLIQQSRMADMGQMINSIAHQWKQPVSILYVLADELMDLIEYNELTSENVSEICSNILQQAEFMNQTIEDFRRFLTPSREKVKFMPCHSMEELFRIFNHRIKKSRIDITVHPHEHFETLGYPNEFKQALVNLIMNSVDVFEERQIENRKIEIYIDHNDKNGIISVEDNGGGIPDFLLPDRLFDSHVTTKGDKGTGIGLQITRQIIKERMGGDIIATNTELGARFEITLPLATSPILK